MSTVYRIGVFSIVAAIAASGGPRQLPDDPDFRQWALRNTGQVINGTAGVPGADIDILRAWAIHPGGANVVVAIVGTGVNPHEEFADRLLEGDVTSLAQGDPYSTLDTGPRGTREAGIIAAAGNDGVGIVGVNPRARILPVRVMSGTVTSEASVADGIVRAVDGGADVVLVPLRLYDGTQALHDAVLYAVGHDAVVVAPTGSDGTAQVAYPAAFDECLAVSSTTNTDEFALFSNYGPQVELSAPSVGIYSTSADGGHGFESRQGGQSGAAYVAGVAALIRSYAPQLSAEQVSDVLRVSAHDLGDSGWDPFFGEGRLDAGRALEITSAPALRFEWTGAIPDAIPPNRPSAAAIRIEEVAQSIVAGSPVLVYRERPVGAWTSVPLVSLGEARYSVVFPALPCGAQIDFYVAAIGNGGPTVREPPRAPDEFYIVTAIGGETLFEDDFEDGLGWQTSAEGNLSTGEWVRVDPVGTFMAGIAAQPEYDVSTDAKTKCFITGQHNRGDTETGRNDVDFGPVRLLSPVIELTTHDAEISYARWFFTQLGAPDELTVEASRDGGTSWVVVETVTGTNRWEVHSFRLSEFPQIDGDMLQLRFTTSDLGNNSLTEAGVDEVRVRAIRCNDLPGDADEDGVIDIEDYGLFISCIAGPGKGGAPPLCPFMDLDTDDDVDLGDVSEFFLSFDP